MSIVWSRKYKILTQFVPISVETDNTETIAQIEVDSGLNRGVIQWMMWAKPPAKCHTNQRVTHLIVYFDSAEVANHAIHNGLYIGSKSCAVKKVLREAQWCTKCQRYGHDNNAGAPHFAKDCKWLHDVCGGCGGNHRLIECPANLSTGSFCVNCNTPDHPVWDRNCEAFKFHCDKLSAIYKDHEYLYFVTDDISTWESTAVVPVLQGQMQVPNGNG
jgi:hypothetical protein